MTLTAADLTADQLVDAWRTEDCDYCSQRRLRGLERLGAPEVLVLVGQWTDRADPPWPLPDGHVRWPTVRDVHFHSSR